jgi:hypothetical protein
MTFPAVGKPKLLGIEAIFSILLPLPLYLKEKREYAKASVTPCTCSVLTHTG